ncbi:MAG TPA: fatty acid desaturase [Erythrobacter sp.]|nr:fatty acid desaturase [Erythrobacter sp.]
MDLAKQGFAAQAKCNSTEDQHRARRRALLLSHPEVKRLVGYEPRTVLWIVGVSIAQVGLAAALAEQAWWIILLAAYGIGAVGALAVWALLHECSHDLVLRTARSNRWLGMVASLPLVLPVAEAFRKYHLMHHRYQGDAVLDGDIASPWECRLVQNLPFRKALWLMAGPLMQSLRPSRMKGVRMFDAQTAANFALQLAFDAAVVWALGWGALAYLLLSNLFALGLHPLGARWIQEHYEMRPGQETYSYYGPVNRLVFNAGMHVEHHDMPRVPWSRLPQLRRIAHEHYDGLYAHTSWTRLLFRFVFDPSLSLESRTIRRRSRRA